MQLSNDKWDIRFLGLALHVAGWSRDPSTKVGAVIVAPDSRIVLGMGYNGFPRGVKDLDARYKDRPTKYQYVVHAEMNAILNSPRKVEGSTLYCTLMPCNECAKAIIQSGITRIVTWNTGIPDRWEDSTDIGNIMFREAGIEIVGIKMADYFGGSDDGKHVIRNG